MITLCGTPASYPKRAMSRLVAPGQTGNVISNFDANRFSFSDISKSSKLAARTWRYEP